MTSFEFSLHDKNSIKLEKQNKWWNWLLAILFCLFALAVSFGFLWLIIFIITHAAKTGWG